MRMGKRIEDSFRWAMLVLMVLLFVLQSYCTEAADRTGAPAELARWRDWVLWQNEAALCPFIIDVAPVLQPRGEGGQDSELRSRCAWPGPLELEISADGARFAQSWDLYGAAEIALPGSARHWPRQVSIDGRPATVLVRHGRPVIALEAGRYRIRGEIVWQTMPEALTLAPDTGAIVLTRDGTRRHALALDEAGRLLLEPGALVETPADADRLELKVFRKLSDGYPMRLETRLALAVSGQPRQVTLGRLLPEGFEPVALAGSLPARVRPDGLVDLQLRPGQHMLTLKARAAEPVPELRVEALSPLWPRQELWSFVPDPAYRVVELTGARSVDPSQTLLPPEWQRYSTYLLQETDTLALIERQRGQREPKPHRLQLKRDLWLAFAGDQLTSHEQISGEIGHLDRLQSSAGYRPGSVTINEAPQLITELEGAAGIEVRPGPLTLSAIGTLERGAFSLSPWAGAYERAVLSLHLPPGYRLFHASGVDRVSDSWVGGWNLWSIFVATLFVVLMYRLFGLPAAGIALLYVLVMHDVAGAPALIVWLLLLGCWAGRRALPAGRLQQWVGFGYRALWLLLLVSFAGFAVDQARQAFYPQLERPWQQMGSSGPLHAPAPAKAKVRAELQTLNEAVTSRVQHDGAAASSDRIDLLDYGYQPEVAVQTGPGLPDWHWRAVELRWAGPVVADQTVALYLIDPPLNRGLNILRILLFLAIAACVLGLRWPLRRAPLAGCALVLMLPLFSPELQADERPAAPAFESPSAWPDPALLERYQARLLAPPRCAPECTALHRAQVRFTPQQLLLTLEVAQGADGAVALPLGPELRGAVQAFTLDGAPAPLRTIGQRVYARVPEGNHRLSLQLVLEGHDQLVLPFELPVFRVELEGDGWRVDGVHEGRLQGRSLSFVRERREGLMADSDAGVSVAPLPAPAFVEVTRTLELGLDWRVETRIRRVAPERGPISLRLPLLAGESVTGDILRDADGRVQVNFAADQNEVRWHSQLPLTASLQLEAPVQPFWVERWRVRPALRWHLEYSGLAPIRSPEGEDGVLEWWPHNGESLSLRLSTPKPLPGAHRTLEQVRLDYTPGRRMAQADLHLLALSSKGHEWPLELPEGAELTLLQLNGETLLPNRSGATLLIPLRPGENRLHLRWSSASEYRTRMASPILDIGPAANVSVRWRLPNERWILWTGGPAMGPAVLFWGVLLVVVIVAQVLGRQSWSPLGPLAWTLLGIGVATTQWPLLLVILGWFVLLWQRPAWAESAWAREGRWRYNLLQLLCLALTLLMLLSLLAAVALGLVFGEPQMQIAGNGSTAFALSWYQDRVAETLPATWVLSLPMLVYRLLILAWSLWLSFALIRWLRWGWARLMSGGFWKPGQIAVPPVK